MIPKPYDWDGILMNIRPIALIETARKILSKILSDRILSACSKFGVLRGDNFSVLKGTSTQSSVFTVSSIVENALEKNREFCLVLQNISKTYDSVGWYHLEVNLKRIKMCSRFISFFSGIHNDRVNRVMMDFGLLDGYHVHDVKWHEHLCGYRIDTKFVARTDRIESNGGMSSFFAAGAFVDDTIWVENCQASMQYAFNIASEFFSINNISINNEKTVVIPINQGVKVALLSISDQPISIAKKGEAHRYLGIFLSTKGLFKPSLAKTHSDVRFFTNVVLRKAIMDKQFSYLVLAVLQPIISYRMQFSFVFSGICHKWDVLVRKGLRSKTCLSRDFPNEALHHSSLYGLKPFNQIQSESKVAAVISFSNALGIFGRLFLHHFLDLQVLGWTPLNLLQFPVKLHVSPVNNFLAGMVRIFLDCELSLANILPSAFRDPGVFSMPVILEKSLFLSCVHSLKRFGVVFGNRLLDKKGAIMDWKTFRHWKKLDPRGPVPHWFNVTHKFLLDKGLAPHAADNAGGSLGCSVLDFEQFAFVRNSLLEVWSDSLDVYTDGSLKSAGSSSMVSGTTAYFLALDARVGVGVCGLLSSTLSELQAVALALECIPFFCSVVLHLDSQAAIDVCVSELAFVVPDFCNHCWIERRHVANLIRDKDLAVSWVKIKSHSGVPGNDQADALAGKAAGSPISLPSGVCECFLLVEGTAVSGNACHFVRDVFRSVCHAHWEAGPGYNVVPVILLQCFDCDISAWVWHPDLHMLAGFTSRKLASLRTYLIKTLHRRLLVAVCKKLYNKCYPGVQYLLYDKVELPNHVFTCSRDVYVWEDILSEVFACWISMAGACNSSFSSVLRTFDLCQSDIGLYLVLCRGFALKDWCAEAVGIFEDIKCASNVIVDFVKYLVEVNMEKAGLVGDDGLVLRLSHCMTSMLLDGMIRLLGIVESFACCLVWPKWLTTCRKCVNRV
ncbi:hypothetical protein G9A89_013785 [Geosiphon pyriformis]|nr:hypothetical protein G9A89_013785 [Geosiphon pyriformis]